VTNVPHRPLACSNKHFPSRRLLLPMLVAFSLGGCATQEFVQKEVGQYDERVKSLEAWFKAVNQGMDTQAIRLRDAEAHIGRVEQANSALMARLDETRAELTSAGQRMDRLTSDLAGTNQRIETASAESAKVLQRFDSLDIRQDATRRRVEGTVAGLAMAEGRIRALENGAPKSDQATVSVQTGGEKTLVLPAAQAIVQPIAQSPTLPIELAATSNRLAGLEAALTGLGQRDRERESVINDMKQTLGAIQSDLTRLRGQGDANAEAIARIDQRVAGVYSDLESARKRVETGEKVLAESGLRLTMVQELLNNQGERLARNEIEAGKVSATAREALERARQAGKLAEGKLVFETTLTNEVANFDFQEAQLNEAARNQLNEFAKRLKAENRGAFIEIQGYTDSSGPAEINLRLSRERAMAVRDYLHQEAGIPLHLLAVAAYGETRPIADNSSREGRGKNRRVVLVVLR
jgi:peptidoglycan-associated lipoprotein